MPASRGTLFLLLLLSAAGAAAQPYRPVDLLRRLPAIDGAENRPLPEALDLAYRAQLSNPQLDRVIARAARSGDPTLRPTLWRLARAYAPVGSFTDQILDALRRLGETNEAFIAEAERVAADLPRYPAGPDSLLTLEERFQREAAQGVRIYVGDLVKTAAVRPDSSFLPRVVAIGRSVGSAPNTYRIALMQTAQVLALPLPEQANRLVAAAAGGYVLRSSSDAPQASHAFTGELPFGPGLDPDVVWSRERLAALSRTSPETVTAAIDAFVAAEAAPEDAPGLRTYLTRVAGAAGEPLP